MFFHNATSVSEKAEDEVDVTGRYPGNKSWSVQQGIDYFKRMQCLA